MANEYAIPEDFKGRIDIRDTIDDVSIDAMLEAASRKIDNYCGRHFFQVEETRYFEPPSTSSDLWFGSFNDLATFTSLATDTDGDGTYETEWVGTEYQLLPVNRSGAEAQPYLGIRGLTRAWPYWSTSVTSLRVAIDGTWGWPEIPAAIREATLLEAIRKFKQRYMPNDTAYTTWEEIVADLDAYRLWWGVL